MIGYVNAPTQQERRQMLLRSLHSLRVSRNPQTEQEIERGLVVDILLSYIDDEDVSQAVTRIYERVAQP